MAISRATLATRLQKSRKAASITQEQAAKSLGIARTAMVQIELGNRAVSSLELEKLARLYHQDIADFFTPNSMQNDEDPLVVLHRIASGLDQPAVRQQVDLCFQLCREGRSLEKVIGRSQRLVPPEYKLPQPESAGEAILQGLNVAGQERQRLGLGDAPIADIAEMINQQGVWATSIDLPDEMSGLYINHPQTGMVILVNTSHKRAPTRIRFSYAHEYGHALMDREYKCNVSSCANSNSLNEKRANAFAAALLMPEQGVNRALQQIQKGQPSRFEQVILDAATLGRIDAQVRTAPGSQQMAYQDLMMIARWFNVSYEAAVYRLRSLNHISQGECDKLLSQINLANQFKRMLDAGSEIKGEKTNSDEFYGERISALEADARATSIQELKMHIAHLAIEAFRREKISRGRVLEIAQLLGLPGERLLEFAQTA